MVDVPGFALNNARMRDNGDGTYDQYVRLADSGARVLRTVVPSDDTDLPDGVCRALWVGSAGNVEVVAADDDASVIMRGVQAGAVLDIQAKRVRAAGTTATNIVAMYDNGTAPPPERTPPPVVVPVSVSPATLPAGQVGAAYNQVVSATGGTGPYSFAVTAGALPAGLVLNGASGVISGTPTNASTSAFTITATDALAATGNRAYSIAVAAAAVVTPALLPLHSRLVTEGDSITAGSNGPSWQQFFIAKTGGRYFLPYQYQQAVGGQTAAQMATQTGAVTALNPKVVTFLAGTNDLAGSSDTPATISANIDTCINAYVAAGAKVVITKVLPRNDATWLGLSAARQNDRLTLNNLIAAKASANVSVVDLESTFNPTTMTGEGLHPNYAGARVLGEAFADAALALIDTGSILPLYSDASNMMVGANRNPLMNGASGSKSVGGTGTVPDLWTAESNDTANILFTSSITTLNGSNATRLVVSGTSSATGKLVNVRNATPYSGVAGEWYEAWVEFSLAAGAQNLRAIYASCDCGQSPNSTQTVLMPGDALSGVLRIPVMTPLAAADTSNNLQLILLFAAGTIAADVTWSKPYLRKVPAGQ
jgi:lysophospholipase L1-like esterase